MPSVHPSFPAVTFLSGAAESSRMTQISPVRYLPGICVFREAFNLGLIYTREGICSTARWVITYDRVAYKLL